MIATGIIGALIYQFVLIRIRGMEISEIMATYAIGLAILEGLRWGGFRGLTYTLPAFIEGMISATRVTCFMLVRAPASNGIMACASQKIWGQPIDH